MWTDDEIQKLEKCLYDVNLDHILTSEEIEVIKLNSTRYSSLKSEIIIPKHNKSTKTIQIKQVFNDLNVYEWVKSVGDCLRWQQMDVWLGFSFLMRAVTGDQYNIVYAYAARELSFAKLKVTTKVSFSLITYQ